MIGAQSAARQRIAEYAAHGVDDVVLVPAATDADPAGAATLRIAATWLAGVTTRWGADFARAAARFPDRVAIRARGAARPTASCWTTRGGWPPR